jgi:AraC family transcriptional regulator
MNADLHTLYSSDFYDIIDFKCLCTDCRKSKPEHSSAFSISFVRKGNFLFNVFRNSLDSYTGCVLVTKPEYERTVTHIHTIPDECTIIQFKPAFYAALIDQYKQTLFFRDNDLHSTLIKTGTDLEFLHYQILQLVATRSASKLQVDNLVIEIIEKTLLIVTDYKPVPNINERLKKNHLITIERAKEYITTNFTNDISLTEIAAYCYVSPFHFSRIFKVFTAYSPHQFLLNIRLKNAEMLLKNSSKPIADIAWSCGFNSIEHFSYAFRQKYKSAPAKMRTHSLIMP